METETTSDDQQKLISSFIEIAVDQTMETATVFLKATNWNLEEAIKFYRSHGPLSYQKISELSWRNFRGQTHLPLPTMMDALDDSTLMCQTPVEVCPEEIVDSEPEQSDSDLKPEQSDSDSKTEQSDSDSKTEQSDSDSVVSDFDETETISDESDYQQKLVSSFTEIACCQTKETAIQFLTTTNWNLEEAINLFLIHVDNQNSSVSSDLLSSVHHPPLFHGSFNDAKSTCSQKNLWLIVNLQSKTEVACHTLNRVLWSNEAVSQALESSFILWQVYDDTTEGRKISTFYKIESAPPVVLLIDPITGQKMRSWRGEIDAHGFVEDLIKYVDDGPLEYIASLTKKNPIKSEKNCIESNQITTDHIVAPSCGTESEESTQVKEEQTCSSSNHIDDLAELIETMALPEDEEETCLEFLELTEEPKGDCDRSTVCSLCVRFPDGKRKQRRFLKSEPIQLLWSFCFSLMEETEKKKFQLVQAIPGASKTLDYGANATFEQSGLANSIVLVTWE